MNIIRTALEKPIAIIVVVAGLLFFGIRTVKNDVKIDILPALDMPVVYLLHSFPAYTPDQMEAYFGKQYVNILSFVNGIKSIETKNIQGLTIMKLSFFPGTDMAQASGELASFVARIQMAFPPATQPPFLIRFDASTIPIGQLIVSGDKPINELLDITQQFVRPSLIAIPGLVSSPAIGANLRTIEINIDPSKLKAYNLSPDQIVEVLSQNTQTSASGNIRMEDLNYLARTNATVQNLDEIRNIPLFKQSVQNVYLKDVATVTDGTDITVGYALINKKRSTYLAIAKSADASTWDVVQNIKRDLPRLQEQLPDGVQLSYEFDQSVYVINSVKSLIEEALIGALLTGLMVLLFLKDWRGALIVIMTIPASIISGVLFLHLFGQTINIMTLSGLALAIGILVDESTVTIENIHQHLDMGKSKARAIWDACREIAFPKLLILLCILAVFALALTMEGISGSLFFPLALAIGFSMIFSYLLSQTFVPVIANYLMKVHPKKEHVKSRSELSGSDDYDGDGKLDLFERLRIAYMKFISRLLPYRKPLVLVTLLLTSLLAWLLVSHVGEDVLPRANSSQLQVRLRAPDGTRIEKTEKAALQLTEIIEDIVGKENVAINSTYIGTNPAQFIVASLYVWTAGPHEALMQLALQEDYDVDIEELKEKIRKEVAEKMPEVKLSFEPIELTDKVLSLGSPTPVEVRISGRDKQQSILQAKKVEAALKELPYLRDVQIAQSLEYPVVDINIDRVRAAQLNTDAKSVADALVASTSSSRFTAKLFWVDPKSNFPYNIQVEVPEYKMANMEDLYNIPLNSNSLRPVLGDVATLQKGKTLGQIDNLGALPNVTVTANLSDVDLGTASRGVREAIASLDTPPKGTTIEQIGLTNVLEETFDNLSSGLVVAILVIFLMLAANFQSFKLSLVVLSTVPAVLTGSLLLLFCTGSTLNLQSYMGIIMAVGVSISNSVLLITNAEELRLKNNGDALLAAREAASIRFRPILMTAIAMVAGMIPMAIGFGDAGDQVSPLGRAVIGGLTVSTFATLLLLPSVFAWVQGKSTIESVSLNPDNEDSRFYDKNQTENER
ncbi:efflux RND transporter permease subunit [Olivibacter sitiensis]|uniref:efflux RND transporter permease subunit n=1 Tax=Olivibacter sitiensis TaxID=376470 RepID=UPI000423DD0B|nr:efflux RND transporter permease subunit [Olivibacter sitiensis]